MIASYKHSSLIGLIDSDEWKKFYNIDTRWLALIRAALENLNEAPFIVVAILKPGNTKGEVSITVDLLFDWFGLVCFANKNNYCQLS